MYLYTWFIYSHDSHIVQVEVTWLSWYFFYIKTFLAALRKFQTTFSVCSWILGKLGLLGTLKSGFRGAVVRKPIFKTTRVPRPLMSLTILYRTFIYCLTMFLNYRSPLCRLIRTFIYCFYDNSHYLYRQLDLNDLKCYMT